MKKIASITCIFECEVFVKPHFKMISSLDENIVLVGRKPFKEYFEAGFVSDKPDKSEELIKKLYPKAHIIYHDMDFFCGDLLNLGVDKAKELGCDVAIKLDIDMLMTKESWDYFINRIKTEDFEVFSLDYANKTMVCKGGDFEHMVECNIFPIGIDPLVLNLHKARFIQRHNEDRAIMTNAYQATIDNLWNPFMVYHFTQWLRKDREDSLKYVESLSGFKGWQKVPEEIINMFYEDNSCNTDNKTPGAGSDEGKPVKTKPKRVRVVGGGKRNKPARSEPSV